MRISLVLSLFLCLPAAAAEVPETIDADTTWTAAESPYHVAADVVVAAGVTLTIEPGVSIEVDPGCALHVHGQLLARGTSAAPVVFTAADLDAGRWGPLIFEDDSVDAVFEEVDEYVSGSILEHCVLEGAVRALELDAASPYVWNSTFRDNLMEDPEGQSGASGVYAGPGSAPRFRDCTFDANVVGGTAWGGGLLASFAEPVIQDCSFVANESPYGGGICFDNVVSPIVGCTFEDNTTLWEGGGVSLYSSSPAFLANHLDGNAAVKDGGGVHVCVDCRPHAAPQVIDNTFVDNTNGALGAGGIGAAYLRAFHHNNLSGNTDDGEPSDLGWFNDHLDVFPAWVTHPDASHNWWGTTDAAEIADAIHDGEDLDGVGLVTYEPFLDGPVEAPTPRVTITPRKLMYGTPDEPMRVFLTIYNPGPALEVDLVVLLQLGDGPRFAWGGPLDYPGAEPESGAIRLTLPENSVWFSGVLDVPYADPPPAPYGIWHAALVTPSGEAIGEPSSQRFELGEVEEVEE